MIHKRPFVDDDSFEVACKHPRHLEHIDQLAPVVPLDDAHPKPVAPDGEVVLSNQDGGKSANDAVTAFSNEANNFESGSSGCFSHFIWINNGNLEADNLVLFPEFFDHGHQLRALLQPEEALSSVDYPLRKPVSIGPEHQAIVPDWEGQNIFPNGLCDSNSEVAIGQSSSSSILVNDGYERLMGTCVIPMLECEASTTNGGEVHRADCGCLDQGSIECVKQHVMESRKKLRENLGEDIFERLGFCDMGECVAMKWSKEEEQLFHDTVLANPASVGKNFWNHLSLSFPSQTKRELVSYYFNVFVLRKRSEQNRFDPLNVDSDDDEWQRSEAGAEEDGDSAVESLSGREAPAYYEGHVDDYNLHVEYEDEDEISASNPYVVEGVANDEEYEGDLDDVSASCVGASAVGCGGNTDFKLSKGTCCNNGNDCDVEDNSCTSYDYQRDSVDYGGPLDIATDGRRSSRE